LLLIAMLIAAIFLVLAIREVTQQVGVLSTKVQAISSRVEGLVSTVNQSSQSLGTRANNIASSAEVIAQGIASRVDVIASAFMLFTVIRRFMASRK